MLRAARHQKKKKHVLKLDLAFKGRGSGEEYYMSRLSLDHACYVRGL